MIDLIIFILVAYGASNIMVYGSIFKGFRNFVGVNDKNPNFFGKLFGCMMCLPFWWGILLSLFMFSPTYMIDGDAVRIITPDSWVFPLSVFFDGCLASGSVYALNVLVEHFED